jgi:hypothetical protein
MSEQFEKWLHGLPVCVRDKIGSDARLAFNAGYQAALQWQKDSASHGGQAVKGGWQTVPRTMTPEMRALLLRADEFTTDEMWIMLLAAAPTPPQDEEVVSYCSDERPCIACYTDTGPCEDAPKGWQPIDTAPKDGSEFVACNTDQGGVKELVSWNTIHGFWQSKGESIHMQHTHWLPLPACMKGEQHGN